MWRGKYIAHIAHAVHCSGMCQLLKLLSGSVAHLSYTLLTKAAMTNFKQVGFCGQKNSNSEGLPKSPLPRIPCPIPMLNLSYLWIPSRTWIDLAGLHSRLGLLMASIRTMVQTYMDPSACCVLDTEQLTYCIPFHSHKRPRRWILSTFSR